MLWRIVADDVEEQLREDSLLPTDADCGQSDNSSAGVRLPPRLGWIAVARKGSIPGPMLV